MTGPLRREEVHTGQEYEEVRAEERDAVVAAQRERRVRLGSRLTLVFESRATIRLSLEELLRADRITDDSEVTAKIDDFNTFVPAGGQLGATLYVEATDSAELGAALTELAGVQRSVYLEVAGQRIDGEALEGEIADELAAASFIAFQLPSEVCEAWSRGASVAAGVAHPHCSERTELTSEQRSAIGADL
jgi:hypothetical protein